MRSLVLFLMVGGLGVPARAASSCGRDADCPGTLVCEEERCVQPDPAPGDGARSCKRDVDCPGATVCEDQRCTGSAASGVPASGVPAPAPRPSPGRGGVPAPDRSTAASVWAILPPYVDPKLGNTVQAVANDAVSDAIKAAHGSVLASDKVKATLAALGVNQISANQMHDILGALAASHAIQVKIEALASGEVRVSVSRYDLDSDRPLEAKASGARIKILRLVKEKAAEVIAGAAPAPAPATDGAP